MSLRFVLNGQPVQVPSDLSPTLTLLQFLRENQHLTGTKEGCAEGDCGACTVAVLDPHENVGWRAVNSCLLLLPMLAGKHVWTVEGIGTPDAMHPAQQALVDRLGSQCGFCTPGFVMSLFEATYREDLDADWKVDDQIAGNLCRCTGYRPIQQAAKDVAGTCPEDAFAALAQSPPVVKSAHQQRTATQQWAAPNTWEDFFTLRQSTPDATLVNGGTDLGLWVTQRHMHFENLLSVERLPGMTELSTSDEGFRIGAGVRLSDLEQWATTRIPPVTRMLRYFGARQIKHRASIGGNLCNASPIGDLAPVLLGLGAQAIARGPHGERTVAMQDFFTGYRQTALRSDEVLAAVFVPRIPLNAKTGAYKVSRRRELDISQVAGGFYVELEHDKTVALARLGFGGMAATPARARKLEAALVGLPWTESGIEPALAALDEDFKPIDDHRASAWYRMTVAKNLVRGFVAETEHHSFQPLPDRPLSTVVDGGQA